jgi:hypothetical protein
MTKQVKSIFPNPKMMNVLLRAYAPCPFFGICPEAIWEPSIGQVPRGFLGCTGELDEVEVVFIFAEPGHPYDGDNFQNHDKKRMIQQVITASYHHRSQGTDLFHRNLLWLMECLWPNLSFDEMLKKVWMTESRLCSIENEIGDAKGGNKKLCVNEYLKPQIDLLPNATTILFGGKARKRVGQILPQSHHAYALSPPGANHTPAKPSWEKVIAAVEAKRKHD